MSFKPDSPRFINTEQGSIINHLSSHLDSIEQHMQAYKQNNNNAEPAHSFGQTEQI